VRKEGPTYDLPIAVGVLSCRAAAARFLRTPWWWQLSLEGRTALSGILPMAASAREKGFTGFCAGFRCCRAALIPDIECSR